MLEGLALTAGDDNFGFAIFFFFFALCEGLGTVLEGERGRRNMAQILPLICHSLRNFSVLFWGCTRWRLGNPRAP